MNYDLMMIKNKYGERMMHLCRTMFSSILEDEGKLFNLMSSNFVYSKFLYDDIVNNLLENKFKDYIYGLLKPKGEIVVVDKTPFELLDEVGYILYECKSEDDIQKFRKYYKKEEMLCTFYGGRLNTCYVFFAVKKNVDEIRRENFLYPERQDLYGTSVISIQFTRGNTNTLSIKNRYNHKVINPDSTFSNNLENIISGLTKSFEREYDLNINQIKSKEFEIPGYVRANDGKFYKYNYEINNIYYCPDNIIIDNFDVIDKYREKEKYIIMDYFIIDLVNKKIMLYDNSINDSFLNDLNNIKKIEINKCKSTKNKILNILFEDEICAKIIIDKCNRIISYNNENIIDIGDNFLYKNEYLEKIEIFNVENIGNNFLMGNEKLQFIDLPNILKIGDSFLYRNDIVSSIDAPKLLEIGNNFFCNNVCINCINLPNLIKVGNNFLKNNHMLINLEMPSLSYVGDNFLLMNSNIEEINLLSLITVGDSFLRINKFLKQISFPYLVSVGNSFISGNSIINEVELPSLVSVENNFLYNNVSLEKIQLFSLCRIGDSFLYYNNLIKEINMENVLGIGNDFMYYNECINKVNFSKLKSVGTKFMYSNKFLQRLELPELFQVGGYFLYKNILLEELYAPKLRNVGKNFLCLNSMLNNVDLSSLEQYGKCFCNNNKQIKKRILELKK